jgi:hypothetical protein
MWICLGIVVLGLIAVLILPFGAALKSAAGKRVWYLIIAGIPIPLPKNLARLGERFMRRKPGKPLQHPIVTLADRFRRLKAGDYWEGFNLHDLREAWNAVRWFMKSIRFRVRQFDMVVASPDPAFTGFAYGMACVCQSVLPREWATSLDVDFNRSAPVLSYHVELTIIPVRLIMGAFRIGSRLRRRKHHTHSES